MRSTTADALGHDANAAAAAHAHARFAAHGREPAAGDVPPLREGPHACAERDDDQVVTSPTAVSRRDRIGRWRKVCTAGLVAGAAFVGLMGLAHLPAGRAARGWVLAKLGRGSACPFGVSTDVAALENARIAGVTPLRGVSRAPSRAMLGFTVGTTSRAELVAWQRAHRIGCHDEAGGAVVRCLDVPAAAFEGALDRAIDHVDDLFIRIDPQQRLVAVDALIGSLSATAAIDVLTRARAHFDERLERAGSVAGQLTASRLTGGVLQRAAVSYRFFDWALDCSATTTDEHGGVTVRMQSRWIP